MKYLNSLIRKAKYGFFLGVNAGNVYFLAKIVIVELHELYELYELYELHELHECAKIELRTYNIIM
jgi:hypothetical protein